MSIQTISNQINRIRKDIADLEKQHSNESKKEADKVRQVNQIERGITKYTSPSTLASKKTQLVRLSSDLASIQSKKADISKKISDKRSDLTRYEHQLSREQEREFKKSEEARKKREAEELRHQRELNKMLEHRNKMISEIAVATEKGIDPMEETYDVFVSHASEDKEDFVRPLVEALQRQGFRVWYDELTLKWGDSLRQSIDRGLSKSKYGIVVLSNSFFKKNWTQYELDGLVTREMSGVKSILPIWHKISKDELLGYSPTLADKKALTSAMYSVDEIAEELKQILQ